MSEQYPDVEIAEELAKGVCDQLAWRYYREENGHIWECGYLGSQLIAIRCGLCELTPLHVMREDLSIDVCRGGSFSG